jgi:hypothetical protein
VDSVSPKPMPRSSDRSRSNEQEASSHARPRRDRVVEPSGRIARLLRRFGGPDGSRADFFGWAVAWFLLIVIGIQVAATVLDNVRYQLWPAYDTHAYWLAAQHVVNGQPLYAPAEIWSSGAFKYPPIFAQLVFPIGWLPEAIVDWAWRICGLLCLRYLCGSWKLAVLASLQWPVFAELGFGNVTLQLGAICLWAFHDRRAGYLLPWLAALKFGPGLLIPYLWLVRPQFRRELAIGCGVFAAACLVSFAVAPGLWFDYAGTFGWEANSQMQAMFVYALVPDHGGLDFALRLAIAAVAVVAAVRWRLDWLAFVAAVATMPIFSLTRLAVLVGLWPLWLRGIVDAWRRSGSRLRRWTAAPLVRLDMLPPLESAADG